MKLNRLTESLGFLNPVRRKEDDQPAGQNRRDQENDRKNKKNFAEILEVTEEKVGAAIDQLNQDSQANAHGLSANVEGTGPGMRVVLKDGSGATIRQFTGEEFLKLRQAAGGGARGKLLDRKL